MNRKIYGAFVLFSLLAFAVSLLIVRGASQVELTPTSGEPGDSVHVEGSDFAASKAVGIGLGAEVAIQDDSGTVTDTGPGTNPRIMSGYTAEHPVKPGSFRWMANQGGAWMEYLDLGNGTLYTNTGFNYPASINYTTGFFIRTMSNNPVWELMGTALNYTTYDAGVLSSELRTDGSGVLSGNFTVPDDIWNGTHTVTVIDELGKLATSEFTVYESDFVPEPFTVGALVMLTSTALVVSFYWLRKKPTNKVVKYS